jgi:hypothetical protein
MDTLTVVDIEVSAVFAEYKASMMSDLNVRLDKMGMVVRMVPYHVDIPAYVV